MQIRRATREFVANRAAPGRAFRFVSMMVWIDRLIKGFGLCRDSSVMG